MGDGPCAGQIRPRIKIPGARQADWEAQWLVAGDKLQNQRH